MERTRIRARPKLLRKGYHLIGGTCLKGDRLDPAQRAIAPGPRRLFFYFAAGVRHTRRIKFLKDWIASTKGQSSIKAGTSCVRGGGTYARQEKKARPLIPPECGSDEAGPMKFPAGDKKWEEKRLRRLLEGAKWEKLRNLPGSLLIQRGPV